MLPFAAGLSNVAEGEGGSEDGGGDGEGGCGDAREAEAGLEVAAETEAAEAEAAPLLSNGTSSERASDGDGSGPARKRKTASSAPREAQPLSDRTLRRRDSKSLDAEIQPSSSAASKPAREGAREGGVPKLPEKRCCQVMGHEGGNPWCNKPAWHKGPHDGPSGSNAESARSGQSGTRTLRRRESASPAPQTSAEAQPTPAVGKGDTKVVKAKELEPWQWRKSSSTTVEERKTWAEGQKASECRSRRERKSVDYTSNGVSYGVRSEVEAVEAAPKRGRHSGKQTMDASLDEEGNQPTPAVGKGDTKVVKAKELEPWQWRKSSSTTVEERKTWAEGQKASECRSRRERKSVDYTSNGVSYGVRSEVEAVEAAPKRGRHSGKQTMDASLDEEGNSFRMSRVINRPTEVQDLEEKMQWGIIEATEVDLVADHPRFEDLVGADVCVMHAAYSSYSLTRSGAVGWRGEITASRGGPAQAQAKVFGSWFYLNDSMIRPIRQGTTVETVDRVEATEVEEARRLAAEEGDSSEGEGEEAEASAQPLTAEGGRSSRERKPVDYTSNRVNYEMRSGVQAVQAVQAAPKRGRSAEVEEDIGEEEGEEDGEGEVEEEEEEEEPAMQDYNQLPPAVERLATSHSKLRKLIPTNEPLSRVKEWVETLEVSSATHAPARAAPR